MAKIGNHTLSFIFSTPVWIIYLGAFDHMTEDLCILSSLISHHHFLL